MIRRIVLLSGGVGSWAAGKRVAQQQGTDNLTLLFADTNMEDVELYTFLDAAAASIGGEFVRIADGRTPWQVFRDERFLGNSRVDPCSKILKRELGDRWIRERFQPEEVIVYYGFDWTEIHRLERLRARLPWRVEAPMCERPYLSKTEMLKWAAAEGLPVPRLYSLGFPHNNCGGFCIKGGQAHFAHLLRTMPERYQYHEEQEAVLISYLGRNDIGILKDRRGGKTTPLTMRQFREQVQAGGQIDMFDWGACGCGLDYEPMHVGDMNERSEG